MKTGARCIAAAILATGAGGAQAHHVMDYATPVTALDGLLSGLGHPVIGVDHLLFIVAAGVLASRWPRGWWLPAVFVAASLLTVAARYAGADAGVGELTVAVSLVVLGAVLIAAWRPRAAAAAALFAVGGAIHGHALAAGIVGAEATPLYAYLAGLAIVQGAMGVLAWYGARRLAAHRPQFPFQKVSGALVGAAGLIFAGLAL